jgi:hypothetical protein
MVCGWVLYWCMYICMYVHGGIPYSSIYMNENATSVVILEGRKNMYPLFDSVTAVGTDIERNYFFFYVFFPSIK